ncbi:MAG TPA: Uma2 family endonuclease [Acetobacteraceae bacterium]|nr:Uma2 family endonuclease [Acetobacteraceae bacterium]
MATSEQLRWLWTAEKFLATDQHEFGDAWRYELVDGEVVAPAAPSPDHGAILSGFATALGVRLRGNRDGCRPEVGSGAVPRRRQRNTARIPDAMIRCGDHPKVVFEVVSPSEMRQWRARDRKRLDLQVVEGVSEIVELYQDEYALHVYRLTPGGSWDFEAIGGRDATLHFASIGVDIPLAEIYAFAVPEQERDEPADREAAPA